MAPLDQLIDELERTHDELQRRMADPAVYADHREAAVLGRRLKELERKAVVERHASGGATWTASAKWDDSGIADLINLITRNSS